MISLFLLALSFLSLRLYAFPQGSSSEDKPKVFKLGHDPKADPSPSFNLNSASNDPSSVGAGASSIFAPQQIHEDEPHGEEQGAPLPLGETRGEEFHTKVNVAPPQKVDSGREGKYDTLNPQSSSEPKDREFQLSHQLPPSAFLLNPRIEENPNYNAPLSSQEDKFLALLRQKTLSQGPNSSLLEEGKHGEFSGYGHPFGAEGSERLTSVVSYQPGVLFKEEKQGDFHDLNNTFLRQMRISDVPLSDQKQGGDEEIKKLTTPLSAKKPLQSRKLSTTGMNPLGSFEHEGEGASSFHPLVAEKTTPSKGVFPDLYGKEEESTMKGPAGEAPSDLEEEKTSEKSEEGKEEKKGKQIDEYRKCLESFMDGKVNKKDERKLKKTKKEERGEKNNNYKKMREFGKKKKIKN